MNCFIYNTLFNLRLKEKSFSVFNAFSTPVNKTKMDKVALKQGIS